MRIYRFFLLSSIKTWQHIGEMRKHQMKDRDTGFSSWVVYFCYTYTAHMSAVFHLESLVLYAIAYVCCVHFRYGRQSPRCCISHHRIVRIVLVSHAMPMQNCIRTLLTKQIYKLTHSAQIRTYVQFILFLHVANQLHNIVFDKIDGTADVPLTVRTIDAYYAR